MCSASSHHLLMPCLLTDQNFTNNFKKGHPRNISMGLFQNLTSGFREEDFFRNSSYLYIESLYSARIPCTPVPSLWTDQNFSSNF